MKKIISFDLDMTLLNHADYKIPDSAMEAIEEIKNAGHIFAISTGRDMHNKYGKPFIDLLKPDALIELNGTRVSAGKDILHEHLFDKSLLDKLIEYCIKKGYAIGLSIGDEDYYFNKDVVEYIDKINWGESFRNFKDPYLIKDIPVRTLVYVGEPKGAMDIENEFPSLRLPIFSSKRGADIIETGHSKANGLKRLCEFYNIDIRDTIAFGDSMNDMEIIKEAGIGVAMGNAADELKAAADFITTDIDKDGILNACIKLGLI